GPLPVSTVATTAGGEALRSITERRLSGTCLVASLGSIFMAAVTSAMLSSGVIAMLSGGPTTLAGASISAMILGGNCLRSRIATVSGAGFCTTVATPLTSMSLLSLAETAICARSTGVCPSIPTTTAPNHRAQSVRRQSSIAVSSCHGPLDRHCFPLGEACYTTLGGGASRAILRRVRRPLYALHVPCCRQEAQHPGYAVRHISFCDPAVERCALMGTVP